MFFILIFNTTLTTLKEKTMTRRMIITIINNGVEEQWLYSDSHLDHGKWMKDSPPLQVAKNGRAEIRTEKQTGAAYGTTGWIKYISTVKPGSTMTITWNKPYGHDDTTCFVSISNVQYTAKVENKDFGKEIASCQVVIKNNPIVIDTKNWMRNIHSIIPLNNIMMPGSHDAGMSELHHCSIGASSSNTQTQQLDIKGQLEAGARYFDIRVDYDHDELVTYHRTGPFGCNGQSFEAVLNQAIAFLKAHSTELAILKISHIRDDSKKTMARIKDVLSSPKYTGSLYKSSNDNLAFVTMGEAKGKIIAVLDYDDGISPEKGLFRYQDGFEKKVCAYRGLNVTVCDLYTGTSSYEEMAKDQIAKWDKYAGFGNKYLFLLSWTLTAGATGSIRELAKIANDNLPGVLASQITDKKKGKPNIVYIDFVNEETTKPIIAYNF